MGFKRVLVYVGVVVMLGSVLSGCVVRPLWWDGGHGHYERDYGPGPGYGGGYYRR